MGKITAKGPKTYEYYFASWKDGGLGREEVHRLSSEDDPRGGHGEGSKAEGGGAEAFLCPFIT